MTGRCAAFSLFGVLLISMFLSAGCAGAVPATATQATPTATQSAIASASTPSGATPVVTAGVPSLSAQDAFNLIQLNKDNPNFIIIDVRTADEFKGGHLANAANIDYYSADFKSNIDKLDRKKEYLIYCRTGIRGEAATQIMLDLGFTRVHNLSGGIVQWISDGYPTLK